MLKVGITGQNGFVGRHLFNTLGLYPEKYERIEFKRDYFYSQAALDHFVKQCDVIFHLAAINRHSDYNILYETNITLAEMLIASLRRTQSVAHVLFSSSSQEERDNPYGQSKRKSREQFAQWALGSGGKFTGMIIPNVFGPFGLPNYNSFVATFCHHLTHQHTPEISVDSTVKLIYVSELVDLCLKKIDEGATEIICGVNHTAEMSVSEVLSKLEYYKRTYFEKGEIPVLATAFDLNLFNTFRSYIDLDNYFPVKLKPYSDPRGSFVEVIRLGVGGQFSFSTTFPGITRGNHFHTRKIERFVVIQGKALIQLRRVGTSETVSFTLDGDQPAYVDMPIWYTHNITNIGSDVLYTNFWINEPYNPDDADTYFEKV